MKNFLMLCITMILGAMSASFMPLKPNVDIQFKDRACLVPAYGYEYKTCSKFTAVIDNKTIIVPAGFQTDLASIPRFLWSIYPPQYTSFVDAAVVHDYLYGCPNGLSRSYVDNVLYAGLRKDGVSNITATNMWVAVRLFGANHFNDSGSCDS